ncbi:MAG TPA: pitrilysin family protein, partial [Methylovirgula sp.]
MTASASTSLKTDLGRGAAPPSRADSVQKIVTKGGIEVWLVEDYAVPLVALEFAFKGGASQDPVGKPGVASLLAGLLDEGAGPYDSNAFHAVLDDYALEISFSADRDSLTGRMQTLARHTGKAFELLRLCVNEARLDEEPFERVKSQIAAGLKHQINDPDYAASHAFRKFAYPDHAYGAPVRGSLATLPNLTQGDLIAMRTAVAGRDGLKIAAVGAIDAATLAAHIDDVFGALPEKSSLAAIQDVSFSGAGTVHVVDLDIPQSTIRFGRQGLTRKDPDFVAATVVNHVLGGGVFSARLFREVREKRGLAYSAYSQLATFEHGAMLTGSTSTKNESASEAMKVIENEIRSLAEQGPSAEELDKAKKYLIGSYALRFDTSTKIAGQLVHLQTDGYGV